jgi:hypothetical protein
MTDIEQWEKENEDFLALIGQVTKAIPKATTTKKDEE